jgi:hypothetical protein
MENFDSFWLHGCNKYFELRVTYFLQCQKLRVSKIGLEQKKSWVEQKPRVPSQQKTDNSKTIFSTQMPPAFFSDVFCNFSFFVSYFGRGGGSG